ncbi:MAG: hypothetical protein MH137_00220 [Flavobacteriales bacterium]|nr:hypothetical protein [Flavobacteriales bacterium]
MINRTNYEAWFVSYLDGTLSAEEQKSLRLFLLENPDLAEELEAVSDVERLVASENTPPFQSLKKKIVPAGDLNESNYEDSFIALHEGDLSVSEIRSVNEFLALNTFLQREADAFSKIRVTHSGEIYPNKSALKHTPVIPLFIRISAVAASVLLFVGVFRFWNTEKEGSTTRTLYSVSVNPAYPSVDIVNKNLPDETFPSIQVEKTNRVREELMIQKEIQMVSVEPVSLTPLAQVDYNTSVKANPMNMKPVLEEKEYASLKEVAGVILETGVGENGLSDGLKEQRKITAGDMMDVAALPFKNADKPFITSRKKEKSGTRDVKIRLGIFEAEFALK